jgi:cytokinin dehydrogenase
LHDLGPLVQAADLGQFGQISLDPIRRSAIFSPLLRMPSDHLCYAFTACRRLAGWW